MSPAAGSGNCSSRVVFLAARQHGLEQARQHRLVVGAIGAGLAQFALGGDRIARAQQQITQFGAHLPVLGRHGDGVLQIDDRGLDVALAQGGLRLFDHVAQARRVGAFDLDVGFARNGRRIVDGCVA